MYMCTCSFSGYSCSSILRWYLLAMLVLCWSMALCQKLLSECWRWPELPTPACGREGSDAYELGALDTPYVMHIHVGCQMRALMSLCVGRAAECTIRRHVYNAGWNLLAILVLARLLVALCEGLLPDATRDGVRGPGWLPLPVAGCQCILSRKQWIDELPSGMRYCRMPTSAVHYR